MACLNTDQRLKDQAVRSHYDQHPFYLHSDVILDKIRHETLLGRFITQEKHEQIKNVVDLGCGSAAKNISFFHKYAKNLDPQRIIGTDISCASLRSARSFHPNQPFLQADHQGLPFKSGAFDFVVATGTFHHMMFPQEGIKEAIRILKTHKYFYLSLYNRKNIYFIIYKMAKIFRLLKQLGLEIFIKYIFVPIYAIFYILINMFMARQWRKIPYREIEMDFYDKFMVPIAHFFSLDDIKEVVKGQAEIVSSNTYAGGMMIGIFLKKIEGHR